MKVLMIEDNIAFAGMVRDILTEDERTSYEIFHAETLRQGIEYSQKNEIQIILLDLNLPDSQGIYTVRLVKGEVPHIPIVVLTGNDDEETAIQALSEGAQDYLIKGEVSSSFLARSIRYAIERSSHENELALYRFHLEDLVTERTNQLLSVNRQLLGEIKRREKTEEQFRKANRALQTISSCNKALVHSSDEAEFLRQLSDIIVTIGGYRFAWVGFLEDDEHAVKKVASAGFSEEFFDSYESSGGEEMWKSLPDKPTLLKNITYSPLSSNQKDPEEYKSQSVLNLPITVDGQTNGILGIYGCEPDAFDDHETNLLQELASDLGFGIDSIRIREKKRQAELELIESEKKYRLLVEFVREGLWTINTDGVTTYINPKMAEMLGFSRHEVMATSVYSYIREEDKKTAELFFRNCLAGNTDEHDFDFIRKDGSRIWTSITASPIIDDNGPGRGILAQVSDITAQKKMEREFIQKNNELQAAYENLFTSEEALRTNYDVLFQKEKELQKSNHRNSALLDAIPDMMIVLSRDGEYLDFHVPDASVLTLPVDHFLGKKIHETGCKPSVVDLFLRNIQETIETSALQKFEYELVLPGGKKFFEARLEYLNDNEVLGIIRDITEQIQAKRALSESEARFKQVAENSGEWIWEVDTDGLYIYSSSAVEKILGFSAGEIIGKMHYYDLFPLNIREELHKKTSALFREKKAFRNYVNLNIRKDGRMVVLQTTGTPIIDADGTLLGYRGVDTDITDKTRIEEEMKQAVEQINTNIQTLSVLNDEIRNPLTVIALLTDEMDEQLGGKVLSRVQVIDSLITQLDKGWVASEKVRQFLMKHYGM